MGTDQKKKKIVKKLARKAFLFIAIILPIFFVTYSSYGLEKVSLIEKITDACFGNYKNKQDYVEFFNVGQGDSTLIKSGDSVALIDFGIKSNNNKIYTNLLKRGIKSIELAVITHHHSDHMGDFLRLAENMKIERLIINDSTAEDGEGELYQRVIKTARENGTEIIIPNKGDIFAFGQAKLEILKADDLDEQENNRSLILMVSIRGKRILFTGDSDIDAEIKLCNKLDLKCDILKLGHHGSKTSSSMQLLNEALPRLAIASCGYDNLYGHPSEQTLKRTGVFGIKVLRTDLDRSIRVVFKEDDSYRVETERRVIYDNFR